MRSLLRRFRRVAVYESRQGRAAEIVGWANAAAALAAGVGAVGGGASWALATACAVAAFVCLRLALAHRLTVWLAAAAGTASVAGFAAAVAWLFAHVVDWAAAPPVAAAVASIAVGFVPARAYVKIARARAEDVPDSLLDPVSSGRSG